jgi:hypothetical protein
MLIAIAIYKIDQQKAAFQRIKLAPQLPKSYTEFFSANPLDEIEKDIIPQFYLSFLPNKIYYFQSNEKHCYIKALTEKSEISLILSKKEIDISEAIHLFNNIDTVHNKPSVKTTLDDIFKNPYSYAGKDILIAEISKDLEEIKNITLENINKLINRGELIEDLQERTKKLVVESAVFRDDAKKLNRCCKIF